MASAPTDINSPEDDGFVSFFSPFSASKDGPLVVFDATHGQGNWAQTGFEARTMTDTFLGLALACDRLGCRCVPTGGAGLVEILPKARLLVVPPPTGAYDAQRERWLPQPSALFTNREIGRILQWLHRGGRLLVFSYRCGDSFTRTNLIDLLRRLGCTLNHDTVLDLTRLRTTHPLQAHFDTGIDLLPLPWSQVGIRTVRWRASATFRILPRAPVQTLALSPGGRCIAFDRTRRQISFASQPVAVAGLYGRGRFAAFGGPHLFESGLFGLLGTVDNARFLRNVLGWLLSEEPLYPGYRRPARSRKPPRARSATNDPIQDITRFNGEGKGHRTVAYVERLLKKSGMLKALSGARWLP